MDTHVYIITAGPDGPVKVGISSSPYVRLFSLQTASPLELSIVHSFPMPSRDVARDVEVMFHATQKEHRVRGEWFSMSPRDATLILCLGIKSALKFNCPDFDDELIDRCLEKAGVKSAMKAL